MIASAGLLRPAPCRAPLLALAEGHVDQLTEDVVTHGRRNQRAIRIGVELSPLDIHAGRVDAQGLVEDRRLVRRLTHTRVAGRVDQRTVAGGLTLHRVRKRRLRGVRSTVAIVRRRELTRPVVGKIEHEHPPHIRGAALPDLTLRVKVTVDHRVGHSGIERSLHTPAVAIRASGQDTAPRRAVRFPLELAGHRQEVGCIGHAAVEAREIPTLGIFLVLSLALGRGHLAEGVVGLARLTLEYRTGEPLVIVGG